MLWHIYIRQKKINTTKKQYKNTQKYTHTNIYKIIKKYNKKIQKNTKIYKKIQENTHTKNTHAGTKRKRNDINVDKDI